MFWWGGLIFRRAGDLAGDFTIAGRTYQENLRILLAREFSKKMIQPGYGKIFYREKILWEVTDEPDNFTADQ